MTTDAEKWDRLAEGLELDAECAELRGHSNRASANYKAAAEARQKAAEARQQAKEDSDA